MLVFQFTLFLRFSALPSDVCIWYKLWGGGGETTLSKSVILMRRSLNISCLYFSSGAAIVHEGVLINILVTLTFGLSPLDVSISRHLSLLALFMENVSP